MKEEPEKFASGTAIEQLKQIKKVLEVLQPSSNSGSVESESIPLLHDVINIKLNPSAEIDIPILADTIRLPNNDVNELAKLSWQDYNSRLIQWSEQLPEPLKSFSEQFLITLTPKLEADWLVLFSELDDETIKQWQQWLNKI